MMAKSNILVVEDERVVADDIRSSLLDLGYAVTAIVASGKKAIQIVEETKPDLVLMDIILKGKINGIDAAHQIRKRFNIPVVYLTAYADDTTLQRARITEPFGYIIKPFKDRELYSIIEMALYKHKMENKLREREQWLNTTLKSIGDAVITTDTQGRVTFMNPVAEKLTGWSKAGALGRDLMEVFRIVNEEMRTLDESPVAKVFREGTVIGLANSSILVAKDGTEIPIDDSAAPICDDSGNISGVVLTFRDITERKLAEERLLATNKRLQILQRVNATVHESLEPQEAFKHITDVIVNYMGFTTAVILTLDDREQHYRVHSLSSSKRSLTGINKILGFPLKNLTVPVNEIFKDADKATSTGKAIVKQHFYEIGHPPFDKSKCLALEKLGGSKAFIMVPLIERTKLIGGIIITSLLEQVAQEDVAMLESFAHTASQAIKNAEMYYDTNKAKELAKETVKRYLELFNEAPVGYHEVDKNGRITRVNATELDMLGYSAEDMVGKYVWNFIEEKESRKTVLAKLAGTIPPGKGFECTFRRQDGTLIPVLIEERTFKNEKGKITGIRSTVQDITERKQAEEEKEKLQAQLLHSQKMEAIGTLAGGVAHDFNNLLTAILGFSTLAMMKIDESEPVYRNLNQVKQSAGRAADLTRQLLAFSRKQPMEFVALNLNKIIKNLLKMLHRLICEDIAINTTLYDNLWTIQADAGNIEQVILNIAINARDAMPEGGRLIIKTENLTLQEDVCKNIFEARPGNFVCLTIEDTGEGMDEENMQRIFEPFFSTKGVGMGTGLGLSVVYGIVKQHKGWINVNSEPGEGSTFKVFLPAVSAKAKDKAVETVTMDELRGNGEKILLVEDDDAASSFGENVLQELGYVVTVAINVTKALEIFQQEKGNFDLVLADVVLPDGSGLDLLEQLRSRKPKLPVLLCSGYPDKKSRFEEIRKKEFPFIQKPYDLEVLFKTIKEVMNTSK